MRNEFTAIVEQDGPGYVAYRAEVLGANGQGKRKKSVCQAGTRCGRTKRSSDILMRPLERQ
jgi:hypothetical protein